LAYDHYSHERHDPLTRVPATYKGKEDEEEEEEEEERSVKQPQLHQRSKGGVMISLIENHTHPRAKGDPGKSFLCSSNSLAAYQAR